MLVYQIAKFPLATCLLWNHPWAVARMMHNEMSKMGGLEKFAG